MSFCLYENNFNALYLSLFTLLVTDDTQTHHSVKHTQKRKIDEKMFLSQTFRKKLEKGKRQHQLTLPLLSDSPEGILRKLHILILFKMYFDIMSSSRTIR